MILDFKEAHYLPYEMSHARVVDADTGEDLSDRLPIFYADDEAGICRYYLSDPPHTEPGPRVFQVDDDGNPRWEERRGPIRIIPADPLLPASDPPRSWATRTWAAIRRTMICCPSGG